MKTQETIENSFPVTFRLERLFPGGDFELIMSVVEGGQELNTTVMRERDVFITKVSDSNRLCALMGDFAACIESVLRMKFGAL